MTEANNSTESDRPTDAAQSFGGLPKWQNRPEVYEEYDCQSCRQQHRYTRPYAVPMVLFGFVFWLRWTDNVFECPSCIRFRIWIRLIPSLLLANVTFPIMLVWLGILYARSYSRVPYDAGR